MSQASHIERTSGAPLAGRSVVVTRAREQAAKLADGLEDVGANVLVWPVIRILDPESWWPVDNAIKALSTYDWVVFTSTNGVDRFFARLARHELDARSLAGTSVAAVGKGTAARLTSFGITADFVPSNFVAEGLIDGFIARGVGEGSRVLVPRALEAREVLPDTLRERGATVDVVPVYRTVRGEPDAEIAQALARGEVDAITFTSASTVANLVELLGDTLGSAEAAHDALAAPCLASIGPITTSELEARELTVGAEADPHTVPGLIDAIVEALGTR